MPVRLKRLLLTLFCALGVLLTLAQASAYAEATGAAASAIAWLDDPGHPNTPDDSDRDPSLSDVDADDGSDDPGVLRTVPVVSIPAFGRPPPWMAARSASFFAAPDLRPPIAG